MSERTRDVAESAEAEGWHGEFIGEGDMWEGTQRRQPLPPTAAVRQCPVGFLRAVKERRPHFVLPLMESGSTERVVWFFWYGGGE